MYMEKGKPPPCPMDGSRKKRSVFTGYSEWQVVHGGDGGHAGCGRGSQVVDAAF